MKPENITQANRLCKELESTRTQIRDISGYEVVEMRSRVFNSVKHTVDTGYDYREQEIDVGMPHFKENIRVKAEEYKNFVVSQLKEYETELIKRIEEL